MFEGNRHCAICEKAVEGSRIRFGVSLSGLTFAFCESCFREKGDEVKGFLYR
jgi:hypothetical protein